METTKELDYFALMAGLSPEEALKWAPLCSSCRERITAALRPGVVWEQEERLALACGAMACCLYQQQTTGRFSQVKLGDAAVQAPSPAQALRLKEEAWELIGDLLDNTGVCLKGTAYEH